MTKIERKVLFLKGLEKLEGGKWKKGKGGQKGRKEWRKKRQRSEMGRH